MGKSVNDFENAIKLLCNLDDKKYVISLNSGYSAIHTALILITK